MRLHYHVLFLVVAVTFLVSFVALPGVDVWAASKQITITITEAQFNRFLPSAKPRDVKSLTADIIDGGIIMKVIPVDPQLPEYREHFGILIRDGKIVAEFGVFDIPGVGALGYADIKNLIPELIPYLDHDAKIMEGFVLRQVTNKAGRRYTPVSVTTGNDKVVIVVTK